MHQPSKRVRFLLATLTVIASGCKLGEPERKAGHPFSLPEMWASRGEGNVGQVGMDWLATLEDPKLEALIAHICGEFETVIGVGIDELYPAYANEINRVNDYLTSLSNTESDKLTQKERQHKELVQTFLRLVIRERANKG